MLTNQRSTNITLAAGSHFYLASRGSAWVALNNPATSGLYWSILCFIDLRMRPDGINNTPPVLTVVSPQYAIVNRTTQIQIPVSDANDGDDIRCRWSVYTPGYRKRREADDTSDLNMSSTTTGQPILIRNKRGKNPCGGGACNGACKQTCPCFCSICSSTTCASSKCTTSTCSPISTTPETIPTLPTTISYASRQAIDECGGICYPNSVPNGTTLSNCTITFKGLKANTWYAVSLQVEDFIDTTSTTPMSSVPVQFLIYVMPEPTCSLAPTIVPLTGCMEVKVGVVKTFTIYAINHCNPNFTDLADIPVSKSIGGAQDGNLTDSPTNGSVTYLPFTWVPQANQIGPQQLCVIAITDEQVQSTQYCVTFIVTNGSATCTTTTTTTVSTSSATTSSSSSTSTSTSTTATSATSTSITSTPTTSSTSTTSTSSTSSTSTTTSITTSTTSTSTTSTSTSTTSTSTTTTTATTSTTSSTSTTSTTSTTTTVTTVTTSTVTFKPKPSGKAGIHWLLILELSILSLLLILCSFCFCLHRHTRNQQVRRRQQNIRPNERVADPIVSSYRLLNNSSTTKERSKTNLSSYKATRTFSCGSEALSIKRESDASLNRINDVSTMRVGSDASINQARDSGTHRSSFANETDDAHAALADLSLQGYSQPHRLTAMNEGSRFIEETTIDSEASMGKNAESKMKPSLLVSKRPRFDRVTVVKLARKK